MQNQEIIIRNYYEDGYRKRAACICVRSKNEDEVNNGDVKLTNFILIRL